MRRPALLVLAFVLLAAGCATPAADVPGATVPSPADDGALRFLVVGDTGTGTADQQKVADAMLALCKARGCDFVLGMGDNIYENGAESPTDPQFEEKFEKPYAAFTIPFYLALGNHDASTVGGEGLDTGRAANEVAYAKRTDRMSDKWNMPDRYYAVEKPGALFLALDTNLVNMGGDLQSAQAAWLDEQLAGNEATWTFAFAHHPLFSNGQHGDAGAGDRTATPLLRDFLTSGVCGKVDVYFAGHDHDLQWLKARPECGATEFIVSGAGAKTRDLADEHNPAWFAKGGGLGFFWVEVKGGELRASVHDGDGKELFARALSK